MNRIEAQLAWAEIEQLGRNAEAARPMVQGAINHRYSLDIARENIDDYELVIAPEAPGLAHLMDINKIIGADPRQMRLLGFNVVLDYQVSDWEIRKRAPKPHPESEAMTPEERAAAVLKPLFNPEPHPLQDEWSDAHSMSLDSLVSKLAAAIRSARLEALEEAAKIAEEFDGSGFEDTWGDEAASGAASCIADAIRERAKA